MRLSLIILFSTFTLFAEIPQTGKNSLEYRKVKFKIWMTLADEHKKLSNDSPEINKKAQKLIQGYAAQLCLTNPYPDFIELANDAKELLKLKPKDPLILSIMGRLIYQGGNDTQEDLKTMVIMLEEANKSIKESQYSLFAKMLSANFLYSTLIKAQDQKKKKENEYSSNYLKAFTKYILSPCGETELRFRVHRIQNFFYKRHTIKFIKPFYETVQKNKHKLDSWLVQMTNGLYHEALSFVTHYNGKFDEKFDDDHHHFYVTAAIHYKEAHNLRPNWPEAAVSLITRAEFLEEGKSSREWFLEAVKAEFDIEQAYVNYLNTIDHNNEELIKFSKECSSTNRYDTLVPGIHLLAVLEVLGNLHYNFDDFKKMGLYDDIHEVLKVYEQNELKHNEHYTGYKNFYRANHFCIAYRIEKYSHVRKLYQMFGNTLHKKAISNKFKISFKPAVSLSYAMSGPASKLVKTLQDELSWEKKGPNIKWRSVKEVDELNSLLEDALAISSEKESELYFRKLKKIISQEKKFNKGEWVNLTFEEGLPAWKIFRGNWELVDKNTIRANTLDHEKQYLSSEAFFKPPYKIELEVESVKSNWRWKHLQAGLILGKMYGEQTGRTFWVDGLRKRVGIGYPEELPAGWNIEMKSKKNKISVYVWDGYHELHTHNPDYTFVELDPAFKPGRVSLGIMPWYKLSGIVKYGNFRLKKINFSKPPDYDNIKERIAHFKQRCEEYPNKYVFEKLAVAYKSDKQYANALKTLEERDKNWPDYWNKYYACIVREFTKEFEPVISDYETALKRSKDKIWYYQRVQNSYAWFLATCEDEKYRNPEKALKLALEVNKKNKKNPSLPYHLGTLAAAYAANGQFEKAVETSRKALKVTKNKSLIKGLNERMELYSSGKAYISVH